MRTHLRHRATGRLVAGAAALALIGLGLSACNTSDDATTDTPDESTSEATDQQTDTNENTDEADDAQTGEAVTLEFWDMAWGPAETYPAAAEALVDQFEAENPGITVNYTQKTWDNWYQTFAQAVGADSAPDVSTGGGFQPFGLQADADAILPLNPLIEQWQSDGTADDFTEGMLDYYLDADGNYLAVPWATDIRVWFYRTDVLEAAGVDVPTTWEEFAAACDTVHQADSSIYGVADGGTPHWTFAQGIAFGSGMFDEEGNAAINSPRELEALEYIASMGEGGSGCINPTATTFTQDEAIEMFNQGQAAFVMDSPSIAPRLSDESLDVVKVLDPPADDQGNKLGVYFVNGIMGYNSTEHPDEVMKFISFWSEHGRDLFLGGASGVSPRTSIDSDPMFDDAPLYREAAEKWGAPVGQPLYALASFGFAALNTIDGDTTMLDLERTLFSGGDVAGAADTAQEKVQQFVDEGR
ncbi:MAG: sugar ABC transporter substrate-binding protein [Bifidobacteriaceae bacterium]|jgi:multiple sugar transport system substrate-binding protein|nr:sugar ABC transporter substrate-binding protein [Bifidobacteriaceae bacterium]